MSRKISPSKLRKELPPEGSTPRSAVRAEPAENNFAVAKNPLTEQAGGRPRYAVPLHIFDIAATVTDEMVMPHAFRVVPCGAALNGHFPHQTGLHQVFKIVVSCGLRRPRVQAIHRFEDFRGCRMTVVLHQKRQHGVALGRAPQPTVLQGLSDYLGVHIISNISNVRICQVSCLSGRWQNPMGDEA